MAAGMDDAEKARRLETLSTARRKLIGQAIIEGILTPAEVALISPVAADYNQGQGDYTQKTGDHKQGGGGYNQGASFINIADQLANVIREMGQGAR